MLLTTTRSVRDLWNSHPLRIGCFPNQSARPKSVETCREESSLMMNASSQPYYISRPRLGVYFLEIAKNYFDLALSKIWSALWCDSRFLLMDQTSLGH
jgi:hypothetical protein